MRTAIILAALLASAPLAYADVLDPVPVRPMAHPAIQITDNAGFNDPLSGVRAGSGTPSDPYVISDWVIAPSAHFGIRLQGTTAHVILRNLTIPAYEGSVAAYGHCATFGAECSGGIGIDIDRAANVTIDGVKIVSTNIGVWVRNSTRIDIGRLELGQGAAPLGASFFGYVALFYDGVLIEDSSLVAVEDSILRSSARAWNVVRSDHVLLDRLVVPPDVTFPQAYLIRSSNVTIRDTDIYWRTLAMAAPLPDLHLIRFAVHDAYYAALDLYESAPHPLDRLVVCGSKFERLSSVDSPWGSTMDAIIIGNVWKDMQSGPAFYNATNLRFERNSISSAGDNKGVFSTSGMGNTVHNNSFVWQGNSAVGFGTTVTWFPHETVDGRFNWWGDASGPSRDGPGAGTKLRNVEGVYEPWLTTAPDLSGIDCDALG